MIWVTIGVETQDLTCLLSAKVRKWWTLIVCSILPHIKKRKVSLHVKMERKHRSVPLGRVHHMFWGKFYCRIFFCVDYFVDTLTHNDTESILGSNSILSDGQLATSHGHQWLVFGERLMCTSIHAIKTVQTYSHPFLFLFEYSRYLVRLIVAAFVFGYMNTCFTTSAIYLAT